MSLATSAAPVAVSGPATAQLLLPAAPARSATPDAGAGGGPPRTSSTSREGTWGPAGASASWAEDRKSTRLNSSHSQTSYAVLCLKKKKNRLFVVGIGR